MSKFSELCDAAVASHDRFEQYKNECFQFGKLLTEKMKTYFEIPADKFSYHNIDEKLKDYEYSPTQYFEYAIHLDLDTGFWNLGVRFILNNVAKVEKPAILVRLIFKKVDNTFILKLGNATKEREFRYTEINEQSFISFSQHEINFCFRENFVKLLYYWRCEYHIA